MKKKGIVLLMVVVLTLGVAVGAFAATNVAEIRAQINYNLKMKLNNQPFNPQDANGSAVRPITYKDTTYLPVRALSEALGVAVDYDAKTSTVLLGEKEWTPLTAKMVRPNGLSSFEYSRDKDMLYVNGKTFEDGLVVTNSYSALGYSYIGTVGKYQKMQFTAVVSKDITVEIKDKVSGEVYKKLIVTSTPTLVELDIFGSNDLKVSTKDTDGTKVVIGEIRFK